MRRTADDSRSRAVTVPSRSAAEDSRRVIAVGRRGDIARWTRGIETTPTRAVGCERGERGEGMTRSDEVAGSARPRRARQTLRYRRSHRGYRVSSTLLRLENMYKNSSCDNLNITLVEFHTIHHTRPRCWPIRRHFRPARASWITRWSLCCRRLRLARGDGGCAASRSRRPSRSSWSRSPRSCWCASPTLDSPVSSRRVPFFLWGLHAVRRARRP